MFSDGRQRRDLFKKVLGSLQFLLAPLLLLLLASSVFQEYDFLPSQHNYPKLGSVRAPELIFSDSQMPGRVLYDPPSRMRQGEEKTITVRITRNPEEDIRRGLFGGSKAVVENISVVPLMSVKLSGGSDFSIESRLPENQIVAGDTFTEWQFGVVPLEAGIHSLTLEVGMRVKLGPGADEVRFHPTITRTINVQVDRMFTAKHFVTLHWEVTATGIIVPIFLVYLGTKLGKKA